MAESLQTRVGDEALFICFKVGLLNIQNIHCTCLDHAVTPWHATLASFTAKRGAMQAMNFPHCQEVESLLPAPNAA